MKNIGNPVNINELAVNICNKNTNYKIQENKAKSYIVFETVENGDYNFKYGPSYFLTPCTKGINVELCLYGVGEGKFLDPFKEHILKFVGTEVDGCKIKDTPIGNSIRLRMMIPHKMGLELMTDITTKFIDLTQESVVTIRDLAKGTFPKKKYELKKEAKEQAKLQEGQVV